MVGGPWRRGSLAALVATLFVVHPAAAKRTARVPASSTAPAASLPQQGAEQSSDHEQGHEQPLPSLEASPRVIVPNLRLTPPSFPGVSDSSSGPLARVLGRVPTASWAMGCAAGVALVFHALYENATDRRQRHLRNCGGECPDHSIDHYKETRERADVALRLSVFSAASAIWLVYNDPQEALERMGQRKLPQEKRGIRVKVKPDRGGVWASVVAYF